MSENYYVIEPHGRHFAVYENPENLLIEEDLTGPPEKKLVAVCVYRVGAEEVVRRLSGQVKRQVRTIFWRACWPRAPTDGLAAKGARRVTGSSAASTSSVAVAWPPSRSSAVTVVSRCRWDPRLSHHVSRWRR